MIWLQHSHCNSAWTKADVHGALTSHAGVIGAGVFIQNVWIDKGYNICVSLTQAAAEKRYNRAYRGLDIQADIRTVYGWDWRDSTKIRVVLDQDMDIDFYFVHLVAFLDRVWIWRGNHGVQTDWLWSLRQTAGLSGKFRIRSGFDRHLPDHDVLYVRSAYDVSTWHKRGRATLQKWRHTSTSHSMRNDFTH